MWCYLSPDILLGVLTTHEINWHTAGSTRYFPGRAVIGAYNREVAGGPTITFLHRTHIVTTIEALMAAKLPRLTTASAAAEWMPVLDHFTLHDRCLETCFLGGALDNLLASVAHNVGDVNVAVQHARASLARYQNPVRLLHAHSKLGVVLCAVDKANVEDD